MNQELSDLIIDAGLNNKYNKEVNKLGTQLARKVILLNEDNVTRERISELHNLANQMFPKVIKVNKIELPDLKPTIETND